MISTPQRRRPMALQDLPHDLSTMCLTQAMTPVSLARIGVSSESCRGTFASNTVWEPIAIQRWPNLQRCWDVGESWKSVFARQTVAENSDVHAFLQKGASPAVYSSAAPKWNNINDVSNKDRQTPLHGACRAGNDHIARLLIERGANINSSDEIGQTPLHWAVSSSDSSPWLKISERLLKHRADLERVSLGRDTPMRSALRHNRLQQVELLRQYGARH